MATQMKHNGKNGLKSFFCLFLFVFNEHLFQKTDLWIIDMLGHANQIIIIIIIVIK